MHFRNGGNAAAKWHFPGRVQGVMVPAMSITLAAISRYPVKGLAPDAMQHALLAVDEGLPFDRRWAIAHATSAADPGNPVWLPKANFLNLAKDEKLAQLGASFDEESRTLTLLRKGKQVARGRLDDMTGRALLVQFLSAFMGDGPRGRLRIVEAPAEASLTDVEPNWLSIINLASVTDIERVARQPIHPQRFRGNLMIDGAEPWVERDWVGKRIRIGHAVLEGMQIIGRCAATEVNPETAERDINLPLTLRRGFGHYHCGLYVRVVEPGRIAQGDQLEILD